jgi:hypothetical protein
MWFGRNAASQLFDHDCVDVAWLLFGKRGAESSVHTLQTINNQAEADAAKLTIEKKVLRDAVYKYDGNEISKGEYDEYIERKNRNAPEQSRMWKLFAEVEGEEYADAIMRLWMQPELEMLYGVSPQTSSKFCFVGSYEEKDTKARLELTKSQAPGAHLVVNGQRNGNRLPEPCENLASAGLPDLTLLGANGGGRSWCGYGFTCDRGALVSRAYYWKTRTFTLVSPFTSTTDCHDLDTLPNSVTKAERLARQFREFDANLAPKWALRNFERI